MVTLRLAWTADRSPYLRKDKDQRTRFERGRSNSSSSRSPAHCVNISEPWCGKEKHSRAILSLIEIRGGSEGLKSEAYDPQKAAAAKTSGKGSSPAKPPNGYDDYTYGNSYKRVRSKVENQLFFL